MSTRKKLCQRDISLAFVQILSDMLLTKLQVDEMILCVAHILSNLRRLIFDYIEVLLWSC